MAKQYSGRVWFLFERAALVILVLLLGGFSLFVGYNKALAPLEVLREHSAWTIHLPILLGRLIGWLEMISVVVLFASLPFRKASRFGLLAALWIGLNHTVAALFHVAHAEWHTLPQSAVMISLCLLMAALWWRKGCASGE